MIGHHAESNGLFTVTKIIVFAGYRFCCCNGTRKHIGIIIAFLVLNHTHQPFKTHPGIYMFFRQVFE
ncbi:MAG: hypothetical protein BWY09_02559 [Candidatus Hydrogenedentes bacterium ADurb.Bin179]|nr:MAG: hypothetical protein BWY09_02559 [Candidatus Hydrogenedentes bacterium ADurb.Bin179]